MSDVITNRTTDYDGSPAGDNDILTANGAVVVTFSGTTGARGRQPVATIYSRSDSADYVSTHTMTAFGRIRINTDSGDELYATVNGVESDASIDLAISNAS